MDNLNQKQEEKIIDCTLVTDLSLLRITNSRNIKQFEGMSFFENINANLIDDIIGSALDIFAVKKYSALGSGFNAVRASYEEELRTPGYSYSKEVVEIGCDYLSTFLRSATILYGDAKVCVDGNPDGLEVVCTLISQFKLEDYGYFSEFLAQHNAKKQSGGVTMSMKIGKGVN